MPTLIDISRTLSPATAVWPGDTPLTIHQQYSLAAGEMVNLTELTVTAHAGTHIDAPWHTEPTAVHPADLDLALYIGPARVVSVSRKHGGIVPEDLAGADLTGVERLLIHTWYSGVPDDRFDEAFPYPTPALIDWLADQGVRLLGLDMPSTDPVASTTLDGHHRLFQRGMVNIENLQLAHVPDGDYELVALPLKLAGICGSPVRAVLRTLD